MAAISGLAGIDFRPRLASIHKKQLYSINAVYTSIRTHFSRSLTHFHEIPTPAAY